MKNGARSMVIDIASETVKLDQTNDKDEEFGKAFEMAQQEFGEKLLLSHAITYDSSQARTIHGPLRLVDRTQK